MGAVYLDKYKWEWVYNHDGDDRDPALDRFM